MPWEVYDYYAVYPKIKINFQGLDILWFCEILSKTFSQINFHHQSACSCYIVTLFGHAHTLKIAKLFNLKILGIKWQEHAAPQKFSSI